MRNRRWIRAIALCLSIVLLVSIASAATTYTLDLSGDGKVNVWDLQVAVNQSKEADHQEAILDDILGGGDELHLNAHNQYEIWTPLGLYHMASIAKKGQTFKLMADIDLGGADWTPIHGFRGIFEGNNHTISNFKITKSFDKSMGFFSLVDYDSQKNQSIVRNLNLKDVEVTATADAQFIGLLAGSNRGKIQNCTTIGVVNDSRTTLAHHVYVGTLVGRNNDSEPDGTVASGTNLLTTTSGTANAEDKVTGLTSKMAMNFADLSFAEGATVYERKIGIAGYSDSANIDTTMIWQDITNSTDLVPKAVQERRAISAQTMYDMCTVEWKPAVNMVYRWYSVGDTAHSSTYVAGRTYYGIPYNHGSSSLNRFNAYINDPDTPVNGYYVTDKNVIAAMNEAGPGATVKVTMEAGAEVTITVPDDWDNSKNADGTYVREDGACLLGFTRYIGTDCTSMAAWGWRKISAVSGTDFANPIDTGNLFPSQKNMTGAGIVPVNGLVLEHPEVATAGTMGDTINAFYNADINAIPEALARASKGDFVVGYQVAGGHCRVLMGDAIAIRAWNGALKNDLSYIVACEQGAGGTRDANNVLISNAKWNIKYTFAELARYKEADDTSKCRYVPITCTALQKENTPAATATFTYKGDTTVKSNFHIEATTRNGETTYTRTTITGSRARQVSLDLATVYEDIAAGDQVTVLLSNGQTYTITYGTAYK